MMKRKSGEPEEFTSLFSNKLYHTLQMLTPDLRKRLHRYLISPYFVQSRTFQLLFEILNVEVEKGKPGFEKAAVWEGLFPGNKYDDVKFRKYCSDLLQHIMNFMAHENLEQDEFRKELDSYNFIVEQKLEPLYNSAVRSFKALNSKIKYKSLQHFLYNYMFERIYFNMMDYSVRLDTRANFEAISQNLDLFYWIEKLKLSNAALSQRKTSPIEYSLEFLDQIQTHLKDFPKGNIPELAIQYYSYLTATENQVPEHYYKFKELLSQFAHDMPPNAALELTDSALAYCVEKLNQGQTQFQNEYFNLFENALKNGLFFQKGELAIWRFNNMVGVALRLGKANWAENFIQSYKEYLPADSRDNVYTFNLARVYRNQGKYHEVIQLIQNVEYQDTGYNLISKAMLLITYYELQEFDALASLLESFRNYLARNKDISEQRQQGYLNLIRYTRKLLRLKWQDKASVSKLRMEIEGNKANTVNHEWLLEKLAE